MTPAPGGDGPDDAGAEDASGGSDATAAGDRLLRPAHPTERAVGIEHYVSDVDGVGGRLRARPEDFRVRELERVDPEPLDADPGAYAHLVLRATLRDWETNDFASVLSDRLGISRERVDWAGTKDKRAVTTQLFSVAGGTGDDAVDPDALADVSLQGAEIDVLGRFGRGIELGDLAGNEFAVTVAEPERPELAGDVTAVLAAFTGGDAADVANGRSAGSDAGMDDAAADEPVSVAVPNYFGQQRFGSRRPITHEVGLAIVRGDWRDAVRTYVADAFESEPESTREARAAAGDCFDDGDYAGALEAMPNRLGYERALLHALADSSAAESSVTDTSAAASASGDDVDGADVDAADPDGNEYRAALDSLPRNLQRLFVHAAQSCAFNRILSKRLERGLPFHRPVEGDVACFAERDAPASSHELAPPTDVSLPDADRTQRVTADRVDSVARHCERGRAFVTAPLVGTETELGDGEPGEIERAVLEDLGLAQSDFDLPEPYDSTGTRRAILVRTSLAVDRRTETEDGASGEDDDAEPGLTFRFALPKGSYATVLLREYLKVDPVELG